MVELISVLMPVYNVEPYLEEAIQSILAQTYTCFELIIVDDCSTDGTYKVAQRLAQQDTRIRLFRNEVNSKICKTLNRALLEARGQYIARMDGDDVSAPERLEVLLDYLHTHPDCALVGSQLIGMDAEGNALTRKTYFSTPKFIERYMRYLPTVSIWMARKALYDALGGYREIPYAEDYDFLLRGLRKGYHYACMPQELYKVRLRSGNTGSSNGLYQHKTRIFVQKLARREKRAGRDLFAEEDLKAAIYSSEKELQRYRKAAEHLDIAVHNHGHAGRMVYHTLAAMAGSPYIINYIFDAFMIRVGLFCEGLAKKELL